MQYLFLLIKLAILIISIITIVYFSVTEILKDSKSKLKKTYIDEPNGYNYFIINLYDIFQQSLITSILTLIIFIIGFIIIFYKKMNKNIETVFQGLYFALLLSSIMVGFYINYYLNQLFFGGTITIETLFKYVIEKSSGDTKIKYENLLKMLHVCRALSFTNFGLLSILVLAKLLFK